MHGTAARFEAWFRTSTLARRDPRANRRERRSNVLPSMTGCIVDEGAALEVPELSVVLGTRNRADALKVTLGHYSKIASKTPWELIVVDNGSSDATGDVLAEFAALSTVSLRALREGRVGVCRARNTGWRAARGWLVAFSDDDCYPSQDFVDGVLQNFLESNLGYLGGRILLYDPQDFPITIQPKEERVELPPRCFVESGLIHGANLVVRRDVLESVGGFDEWMGPGTKLPSGEDVDLVNRASAAGYSGAYDPRPVVYHHHRRRTDAQVAALIRGYNLGRGGFFMKAILDPSRRALSSRQWYWRTFLPACRSREAAVKCLLETRGAVRYLFQRCAGELESRWGRSEKTPGP